MKRRSTEDAQIKRDQAPHAALDAAARTPKEVVQRWRDLRGMLIRQLDMFETGGLTLRSNNVNISAAAIHDLKHDILEFDALILDSV